MITLCCTPASVEVYRNVYVGDVEISVYISSDRRGKDIGNALLDALITGSEKERVWTLRSGIMEDNFASIRLREKCGCRMAGFCEKMGRDRNRKWRDTLLMERRSIAAGVETT